MDITVREETLGVDVPTTKGASAIAHVFWGHVVRGSVARPTSDQQVRIPAAPPSATLGKLFTHVPLSASSIIWYQPMGGDARRLGR